MPTLVRLVANQDGLRLIRNSFKDELILPANSKVSLVDCNLRFENQADLETEIYRINGETIKLTSVASGANITVQFDEDYNNRNGFLVALRNKLNLSGFFEPPSQGLDFDFVLDENSKITIELSALDLDGIDYSNDGSIDGTWSEQDINKIIAESHKNAKYLSKSLMGRAKFFIAGVYEQTNSDFRYGFLRTGDSITDATTFTGVEIPGDPSGEYKFFINGTLHQNFTGIGALTGDVITMMFDAGVLKLTIERDDGTLLVDEDITLGVVTLRHYVENLATTDGVPIPAPVSPAIPTFGGMEQSTDKLQGITEVNENNITITSNITMTFSPQLQQYLGFDNASNTSKSTVAGEKVKFLGSQPVSGDNKSKGILVTLEGVGRIGSFDGNTGKTTETVCILPETAQIQGTADVKHTTPYLYQLDLRNIGPQRVNSLFVRFYTSLDDPPLALRSGSVVSLLFT